MECNKWNLSRTIKQGTLHARQTTYHHIGGSSMDNHLCGLRPAECAASRPEHLLYAIRRQ